MNLKLKHSLIFIASVILLGAALFVPMPARDSQEMGQVWFGYPFRFLSQDFSAYDTLHVFPRYQRIEPSALGKFNGFSPSGLAASLSIIFLLMEAAIYSLELANGLFRRTGRADNPPVRPGYTLIELMVIVGTIALLATIVLGITISQGQRKAVIASYKSSMQSLRRGMELCKDYYKGFPPQAGTGAPLSQICGSSERFPSITGKCNPQTIYFRYTIGNEGAWAFTSSDSGGNPVDCRGCRLVCDETDCTPVDPAGC